MRSEDAPIDWNNLDLSSDEKLSAFTARLQEGGRKAVAEAIAAGNPIYFADPADPEILVKEMPDVRRFQVAFAADETETLIRPLPAAPSPAG